MLFNSIEFALFLPIVFGIYWALNRYPLKYQNIFLLLSSYLFYGWWDYRFLFLIFLSSSVDFIIGLRLWKTQNSIHRKYWLALSLSINLGLLGVFKYYNFFVQSFVDAFTLMGYHFEFQRLSLILPVGISFYTFQTLSYSIDIYRRKLEPTTNFISFSAFVSFFPQLVAGPIERASNLLPQFFEKRRFHLDKARDGLRQILWGLFKKMVIADNCAIYVNAIFANYEDQNGSTLFLAAVLFAFQIYGDFSGYSDIAIGTAKLLGFSLMKNFAFPYFSRDIAEFWRRWHISLSTWFRDYLYIPLGGSRGGLKMKVRNIFAIFLVSGFWHGANWTFIVWGFLNALYYLPLMLSKTNRVHTNTIAEGKLIPSFREFLQVLVTFSITVIAWIFFRAESISQAIGYIGRVFSPNFLSLPNNPPILLLYLIGFLILLEWVQREKEHGLEIDPKTTFWGLRYGLYTFLAISIDLIGGANEQFIYFQF